MTTEELIQAMGELTTAIRQYQESPPVRLLRKAASEESPDSFALEALADLEKRGRLRKAAGQLVKVAFTLGPAGQVCPTCRGSGRV